MADAFPQISWIHIVGFMVAKIYQMRQQKIYQIENLLRKMSKRYFEWIWYYHRCNDNAFQNNSWNQIANRKKCKAWNISNVNCKVKSRSKSCSFHFSGFWKEWRLNFSRNDSVVNWVWKGFVCQMFL